MIDPTETVVRIAGATPFIVSVALGAFITTMTVACMCMGVYLRGRR